MVCNIKESFVVLTVEEEDRDEEKMSVRGDEENQRQSFEAFKHKHMVEIAREKLALKRNKEDFQMEVVELSREKVEWAQRMVGWEVERAVLDQRKVDLDNVQAVMDIERSELAKGKKKLELDRIWCEHNTIEQEKEWDAYYEMVDELEKEKKRHGDEVKHFRPQVMAYLHQETDRLKASIISSMEVSSSSSFSQPAKKLKSLPEDGVREGVSGDGGDVEEGVSDGDVGEGVSGGGKIEQVEEEEEEEKKKPEVKTKPQKTASVCPECHKVFANGKYDMQRHVAHIHRKEMSYQCQICVKGFCRKDNYVQHMRNVHGQMNKVV